MQHPLAGVYAAAVTPLNENFSLERDGLLKLLDFLANRGCHGALLLGTTGEGPSFSVAERLDVFRTALQIREDYPDFRLFAGVGTPSLEETASLTKMAYELGFDAALALPPYYYRGASEDGLFVWFDTILSRAVPSGAAFFGYHFPRISGVPLSLDLLERLLSAHPDRFRGIKDSSADPAHAQALHARFGSDLMVLNGTDSLFSEALELSAQGAITALGNLVSPDLRAVWESFRAGKPNQPAQGRLTAARKISENFPPAAPLLKSLLHEFHGFPLWPVKPPLQPMPDESHERAMLAWRTRGQVA